MSLQNTEERKIELTFYSYLRRLIFQFLSADHICHASTILYHQIMWVLDHVLICKVRNDFFHCITLRPRESYSNFRWLLNVITKAAMTYRCKTANVPAFTRCTPSNNAKLPSSAAVTSGDGRHVVSPFGRVIRCCSKSLDVMSCNDFSRPK